MIVRIGQHQQFLGVRRTKIGAETALVAGVTLGAQRGRRDQSIAM